jgi:hypothetical protein
MLAGIELIYARHPPHHQARGAPDCGSFEVRFPDDRPSQYFYWDDIPARRLRPETLDRETALEQAKAVARAAETA